jgi:hypothetical protein
VQLAVWCGKPELGKEHGRELVVEVLTRMDKQLLMGLAQVGRDGGGFDELRAITDYGDDLQRPSSD